MANKMEGDILDRLSAVDAITGRCSIRRFMPNGVSDEVISEILSLSARAPSGTNSQPWLVHVVTGAAKERLSDRVREAAKQGRITKEYDYAPNPWWEPYVSRRRKVGFDLYALYGIERHDMEGRAQAVLRNFEFFGAPVGLFFSIEKAMTYGSWLDMGMFMQNVMILARTFGLDTCPQQAWCEFGGLVRKELGIDDKYIVVSGMSLGVADPTAAENTLETERCSVKDFATFVRE
ncbi:MULTISPECIES: nitroreductase [Burkholderia cepacia complex]|uniref:nitroreductase n=1 Tax=Burkholderia cepacia complex TaxID=87882 RepID=UPI001CF375F8|nr:MULTISPECIES: nitroreductase [Burkholderia cepacia complex]MCA8057380.1 nitroreductase [Burkholderia cepacia]MDN7535205.1 nitroreductase [Burkholderia orbicola]